MNLDKQFIIENILSESGRLRYTKLKKYNLTPEDVYLIYFECEKPLCLNCKAPVKFQRFNIKNDGCYATYCSRECVNNSDFVKVKRKETAFEKYVDANYNNSKKNKETRLKNRGGVFMTEEEKGLMRIKSLEKYGVPYPFMSEEVKEKCRKTKMKLYGDEKYVNLQKREKTNLKKYNHKSSFGSPVVQQKAKESRIKNGSQISDDCLSDYEVYYKIVWKITNSQPIHTLENFEKRGRSDLKDDAYSLDHKYSIKRGFINNIPTYLIANINNLEMLPYDENRIKKDKCSITIDKLCKVTF